MLGAAERADHRGLPRPATPTGLRVALGVIVGLVVVFSVVGVRAIAEQQRAAEAVGLIATPALANAEGLYVALAEADAAASTAFLQAGSESAALRAQYVDAVERVGAHLADIGTDTDVTDEAADALTVISQRWPVYTGQVERARANNRLGFPVGAASLRMASEQMRDEMLPAATVIYESAAGTLDGAQRTGASADAVIVLAVGGGVVLVVLLATQVFVTLRTRRLINVWLVAATVLTVVVGAVAFSGLADQRDAIVRSRQRGSDPLLALSIARILALRSMNDQNLDLIARGTDPQYLEDFDDVTASIGGRDGLLAAAAAAPVDGGAATRLERTGDLFDGYLDVHDRVGQAAYRDAVDLATTEQARAAARLDDSIAAELTTTRASLERHAADAREIGWWVVAIVVGGGALVVALSVAGVHIRLREFR